ncbi:MAG: hypothetical protein NTX56_05900 [Proteobacteria bacterium]|nr:hypothetical protein [Pseudomonadota bacterium]
MSSSSVEFDLAASGQKLHTGWIAGGDGLLVLDRDRDGLISDGAELFGSATRLPDGEKAGDGFAALRALDTNGDGLISSVDKEFANLKVWVDADADGVSRPDELKTLDSLGIAQLDLNAVSGSASDHGNLLGLVSSYATTDGVKHELADVWFATENTASRASAMLAGPAEASAPVDLRALVSHLTQAIAAFKEDPEVDLRSSSLALLSLDQPAGQRRVSSANVSSLVGVLQQFDAQGKLVASPLGSMDALQSVWTGTTTHPASGQEADKSAYFPVDETTPSRNPRG